MKISSLLLFSYSLSTITNPVRQPLFRQLTYQKCKHHFSVIYLFTNICIWVQNVLVYVHSWQAFESSFWCTFSSCSTHWLFVPSTSIFFRSIFAQQISNVCTGLSALRRSESPESTVFVTVHPCVVSVRSSSPSNTPDTSAPSAERALLSVMLPVSGLATLATDPLLVVLTPWSMFKLFSKSFCGYFIAN